MSNLIPCPDCGHMISPAARACPQCGKPIARRPEVTIARGVGRGVLWIILVIVALAVVVGWMEYALR